MTKFSAFMHDKLQLFTVDVVGKARELKDAGYSVMTRSGYTSAGQVNSTPSPLPPSLSLSSFCYKVSLTDFKDALLVTE